MSSHQPLAISIARQKNLLYFMKGFNESKTWHSFPVVIYVPLIIVEGKMVVGVDKTNILT